MSEEIRRSGRATKGQYTKDRDVAEEAPATRKGRAKGKGAKAKAAAEEEDEEEENAIIRCVCGQYEEEEETSRSMICCDNCEAWQHNDCMGLPDDPSYQPAEYFCEQCKPANHQKLLEAVARGERPWEEAARRREEAASQKSAKRGKKGRKSGGRTGEAGPRESAERDSATPSVTARGSQKRKIDESPAAPDLKVGLPRRAGRASLTERQHIKKARASETAAEPKNGTPAPATTRKSSAVSTPSRQASRSEPGAGQIARSVDDLTNAARKGSAGTLIKIFIDQTKAAVNQGSYAVPSGMTPDEIGTQLGLRIEHALYHIHSLGKGEPNDAYKAQTRTIMYNIRKNEALRDRILKGEVSPHGLASMHANDMQSEEQRRKDEAVIKEAEKQHTIVQEPGPRIRRTHKGEEYVDENHQVARESATSNAPARRESVVQEADPKSPDVTSPPEATPPAARAGSQGRPRPSIDTQRKSSANFDIDNVWSTVQGSPDATQQRFPEIRPQSPHLPVHEPVGPGAPADADIDALLKDEEAESPPYSPKDFGEADGIVWRGVVNGGNLGKFQGAAKFAAGCPVESLHLTYQQLIPSDVTIGGRIDPAKADDYLCGLQYSQSSDVVVVSIARPDSAPDAAQFEKLFTYFKSRNRYGVGTQHQNPAIKDIYLIPLETGQQLPGLLQLLESSNKLANPVTERMILVPFVVKNTELAHSAASHAPSTLLQTPITPHEGTLDHAPGNHNSHNAGLPVSLPYQPSASNGTSAPYGQYAHPPPHYANAPHPPTPSRAALTAQAVLGPELAAAPAVLELISQAPNAGEAEMNVVKDCIAENAMAARDLAVLTGMLHARYDGAGGAPGA